MALSQTGSMIVILGVGLIIFELMIGAATGFDLFIVGFIFIISGIVGMVTGSITLSLLFVCLLCGGYVFFGRKFIKSKLHIKTTSTNIDRLIERRGIVIKEITPQEAGQVKLDGEVWRARSDKFLSVGTEVVVISVSGVTLEVK